MVGNPIDQYIRDAAYYKWIEAGQPSGDDLRFWLEAEQERLGYSYDGPAFYSDALEEPWGETFLVSVGTDQMETLGVHLSG